ELLSKTSDMLEVDIDLVDDMLRELALNRNFHISNDLNNEIVYYMPFHVAENNVATKIVELSKVEFKEVEINIEKHIKEIGEEENIKFGKKQILAIEESLDSGVVVITGGPGTGKTTTINAIIKIYEDLDLKVVLAAPTGRASKRMTETTGKESKTIHRLLEFSYLEEDMAFNKDEDSPIEGDVVIIDEASMIDILLMNSLLKAIDPGTRLILVGDIDQLPSVGAGNVLKDIINSESVNVVKLDEIFRQAEKSMIVINAHRINRGEKHILNEKDKDFYFINTNKPEDTLKTIIGLNKDRLPNFYNVDPTQDIQVLTPMKRGDVGTNSLNKHLQAALNPKSQDKEEK